MNKLKDIAEVIRSKNSGPFELTFDIIFKSNSEFQNFTEKNIITKEVFAKLYGINQDEVLSIIAYEPARALKITIKRPIASGSINERDVYGAQQHKPLLEFTY